MVSGAPGTGVLGLGDEDWSNRVGDAAAEVVFRLAAEFPDAVAEGWWRGARRDRAVAEFAGAVEVFCRSDRTWPRAGRWPGASTDGTRSTAT